MLKKKFYLFVFILGLIVGSSILFCYSYPVKKVTIVYGKETISFSTHTKTVKEAIKEAKINLNEADIVIPAINAPLPEKIFIKILRAKSVFIIVDGKTIKTITHKNTVKELLNQLCIDLKPGDIVKPSQSRILRNQGYNYICIKRAKSIMLKIGNDSSVNIKSTRKYVYQVLEDKGICLNSEDRVYPCLQTPITQGTKIQITKVEHKLFTEKETVPYRIITREDPTITEGKRVVTQEGQEGIIKNTVKIYYKNQQMTSEDIIKRELIRKPVDEVVLLGTKVETYIPPKMELASRGSIQAKYVLNMDATAYEPSTISCGPYATGYTATGMVAKYGVVAVDPAVIPLGTRLYIEGYGYAIAADTGSAIWGNRIDLCFNTYQEAINFGRKNVKVYILN